jgi:hypothetical protein
MTLYTVKNKHEGLGRLANKAAARLRVIMFVQI